MVELFKVTLFVISTMAGAGFDCEILPITSHLDYTSSEGSLVACTNSETMVWELRKIIVEDGKVIDVKFSNGKTM